MIKHNTILCLINMLIHNFALVFMLKIIFPIFGAHQQLTLLL